MQYKFLETSDEALLEGAKLPLSGGASLALFTTGYDTDVDETVSLSIVSMDGDTRFSKLVKPHNREEWTASQASGGLSPETVGDVEPLYEYEEQIDAALEGVEFVLCQHIDFVKAMLDRSWIALPGSVAVDVCELFRLSHCMADRPGEPATVATIEGIADYYGFTFDSSTTDGVARANITAYRAIVSEFIEQRDAKGADYWEAYDRRAAEQDAAQNAANSAGRIRERRYQQMNALLWVAAGLIFVSLIIQLYQRGGDIGFMLVAGAAAVFAFVRAVINWNKK